MGRRRRRRVTAVAGAALLASLTVAFLAARRERPRPARARVAVADFANETDDKDLAGLSGMLITALEQSKRLSVLTRGTMYELLGRTGTIPDRIEEPLAREMARRASVDYLVLASIRRFGEVYAVDVKVLDPDRNEYLFAAKEQGRGKEEIPALIDRVSERLRLGFAEPVDEVHAGAIAVAKTTSASVEAYRHLFAGEDRLLRNDHTHATGEFRLAIALDPDFALAHLRLSQTLGSAPGFTSHVPVAEGDTALLRALQLADRLPESARCTALAELELYEYRGREALARVKACADRYPDDAFTIRSAAEVAFHTGDLDAAVRYFGKSGGAAAAWHLQRIWWMRGDFERMRADAAARAAGLHEPQFLVWAEMGAGDEAAAERTIAGMEKLHPEDPLPCTLRANLYLYGESPEKADALLLPPRRCWPVMPKALDLARGRFRKRLAEARAAHAAATASGDGTAAGWALVDEAVALLSRGGPADTADLFSRAARLVPEEEFVGTWMRLGGRGVAAAMARLRAAHAVPGGFRPRYDDWTAWVRAREQGDVAAEIAAAESLAHGAPTDWRSVLPRLGNLYLRAHQPQKAIAALRASLGIRHPNFYGDDWGEIGHVLHDLGAACEEAGDAAGAREAYTRLLRLWSDADPDIPDLIDARARLAALH